MASGIKSKKNWQRKLLSIKKINEMKNWCTTNREVPIHTHGLLNIVRAVIDEIAPMMGEELATEQARLLASYHLAVVSGRQVRCKISCASNGFWASGDCKLSDDLGFYLAKHNFLPIIDYINHTGKFEKKVGNSNENVKYIPIINTEPNGIGFLSQATDRSMEHAQGIPVIPNNGDVSAHFKLPNDIEEKYFDEFQKRMRNFRNPEVALPSFDLKKSRDYVTKLLQHATLHNLVEVINFELNGSPIQLAASNGNGKAWSSIPLTTRELFLGSVYGFGERFFDVDFDIHEERIAAVKYHFDTEDVTRVIVHNALRKKNWVTEYIPRNAISESPLQIRTVPINTHRLLDIIWNVITSIQFLSKMLRKRLETHQARMDAFYHLAVWTGYQVRMKVLLAQQKFPMKVPLNFEQRKELYAVRDGLRYHRFKNFRPIADYIDHIGNFKHGNVFYIPELNMPPDGLGFLRQATDLSMKLAQSFISENGGIPADFQLPGNINQDYSKEIQERLSEFRFSANTHRTINLKESEHWVFDTLMMYTKVNNLITVVDLEADGTEIQVVASKAENGECWSNIELESEKLYLGTTYGFGECFFGENSHAHKPSISIVKNYFYCASDQIRDLVVNDIQQEIRESARDSSSSE